MKCNPCRFKISWFESSHPDQRKTPEIKAFQGFFKKVRQQNAPDSPMGVQKVFTCTSGKRWYVYFYTLNDQGKKERNRLYGYVNLKRHRKDRKKRLEMLETLRQEVTRELNRGRVITDTRPQAFEIHNKTSIGQFIKKCIADKKKYQRVRSRQATKYILGRFTVFLEEKELIDYPASFITRTHIKDYRNHILDTPCSNRTANDHMIEVKALFNYIINNYDDVIEKNPCRGIRKLPQDSEKNKAFTMKQTEDLRQWMTDTDPQLLFFCKFIVYCFMRPTEIRKLKIKYFDLDEGRIIVPAGIIKNRAMIKFIPKVFLEELKERLAGKDPEHYLFTNHREPGSKMIGINNMTRRFKKGKDKLGLGKEYTMYGFKHTFIGHLVRNGLKAKDIMPYSSHETMEGFETYARDIKADRPKDISSKYSLIF